MSLRIGLDFDNTIACYDHAFPECAKILNDIPTDRTFSKAELKQMLMALDDGEYKWQRVQGQVYGKFISFAELFPGLADFLRRAKHEKAEIFIVSHKTDFGHFDEAKINLREAARGWMTNLGFFDTNQFAIDPANVFFEYTREEKVTRIKSLHLNFFVDDLIEVFNEPSFPKTTEKLLFNPLSDAGTGHLSHFKLFSSWQAITAYVFAHHHK